MSEFKTLAIKRQVSSLFSGSHFSICDFDNVAKLMGAPVNGSIYRQLRAYHCVEWADMTDREKELIQQKVVEALRGDNILNPARVLSQLTDEGSDFAFTEDRYLNTNVKRIN
jgi:hypothetical protein